MTIARANRTNPNRAYFHSHSALRRCMEEAPYFTRCSDDKTAKLIRPRHVAFKYPYVRLNRADMVFWLIFDVDKTDAWGCWADNKLPAPNLIVRNRKNGQFHLYYAITPVCTSANARAKPIAYMKVIYQAMAEELGADPFYRNGAMTKTPGHPWWDTHELHAHVYELGELADYVDLKNRAPWKKGPELDGLEHSRHCILFEQLRHFAYAIVNDERQGGSFEKFSRRLETYATARNRFRVMGYDEGDLPHSSIRSTVRSVARWTWDHYTGRRDCARGIMLLDPDLPIQERQALAARRTHCERTKATENKLRAIAGALLGCGKAVTQAAVAFATGLSRQTVAKYQHVIEEVKQKFAQPVAPALNNIAAEHSPSVVHDVKYAGRQVTATLSSALPSLPISAANDQPMAVACLLDG